MNKDQLILEQLVEEVLLEVKGHGSYKELREILFKAEKMGIIRWAEKNGKVFIFSLVDDQKYIAHAGEVAIIPVKRFLNKLVS